MKTITNKFFLISLASFSVLGALTAGAQYYYPQNYNYDYSNNNNGYTQNYNYQYPQAVTTFDGGNYNSNYYGNYSNNYPQNYNYNNQNTPCYSCNSVIQPPVYNSGYVNNIYSVNPYNYSYNNYSYQTVYATTYAATSNFTNSATINGYISMTNGSYNSSATAWFQYGSSSYNLNLSTNPAQIYSNTNINSQLTNLACGTTYYFRAVASGQNGLQYGSTLSFTTQNCIGGYGYNYGGYGYAPSYPQSIQTNCVRPHKTRRVVTPASYY